MSENTEHHAPKTLKQKFFAALKNPPSLTHPKTLQGILLAAILISLPLTVYVAQIEQDPRQQAAECQEVCDGNPTCRSGEICDGNPTCRPGNCEEICDGPDGECRQECGEDVCDGPPQCRRVEICDGPPQCRQVCSNTPQQPTDTPSPGGGERNTTPDGQDGCNDNVYYCDAGVEIHKHGGYKGDDGQCVYAFDRGGSCTGGGNSGQGGTTGGSGGSSTPTGPGTVCKNPDAQGNPVKERGTNPRAEDGRCWTDEDPNKRKEYQAKYCTQPTDQCQAAKDKWMEDTDAACRKDPICNKSTSQSSGSTNTVGVDQCRNGVEGCNNPCSVNGQCWKDLSPEGKAAFIAATGCKPGEQCQKAKVAWMTQADNSCKDGTKKCPGPPSTTAGTGGTTTAKPATNPSGGYCVGNTWHDEATNNENVDEAKCGGTNVERCMYSEAKQGEATCYLGECTDPGKGCGFNSNCKPAAANFGAASFCPGKAPDNFASDDPAKLYNLCRQAASYKSSQKACTNGENRAVSQADLDRLKKNWEAKAAQAATQPSSQTSSPGSSSPAGPRTGVPAQPAAPGQPAEPAAECSAEKACPSGQTCDNGKCTTPDQKPASADPATSAGSCPIKKAFDCEETYRICSGKVDPGTGECIYSCGSCVNSDSRSSITSPACPKREKTCTYPQWGGTYDIVCVSERDTGTGQCIYTCNCPVK